MNEVNFRLGNSRQVGQHAKNQYLRKGISMLTTFLRPALPSFLLTLSLSLAVRAGDAATLPLVSDVEWQPLAASLRRLSDAATYLGAPFRAVDQERLQAALADTDTAHALTQIQEVLDRYCLFDVN